MLSTETLFGPNFSRLRSVMLPDRRADTETVRQVDTVLDPLPTLSIARPTCDIDDKLDKDRSRRWWPAGVVLLIVLGVTLRSRACATSGRSPLFDSRPTTRPCRYGMTP